MKVVKIVVISAVCLFLGLLGLGLLLDEGGTKAEKIERECRRSYGDRGEQAVLDCQLAMTVRFINDADRNRANSTYDRIR